LNSFAQAHIVSEDDAARSRGERDTVELIRQQLGLEQFAAQRVRLRLAADLRGAARDAVEQ
jgi:hypothetical protein